MHGDKNSCVLGESFIDPSVQCLEGFENLDGGVEERHPQVLSTIRVNVIDPITSSVNTIVDEHDNIYHLYYCGTVSLFQGIPYKVFKIRNYVLTELG